MMSRSRPALDLWVMAALAAIASVTAPDRLRAESWVVRPTDFRTNDRGDLAIAPDGRAVHAFVGEPWPRQLSVAARAPAGTWSPEPVGGQQGSAGQPSLAFGPDGQPGIAHYEYVGGNLVAYYAARSNTGAWSIERVSPGEGQEPSLAYSPTGRATMTYLNTDSPSGTYWSIDFAERTGPNSWSVQKVATSRYIAWGQTTSLAYSPVTGQPGVSFLYGFGDEPASQRTAELRYAYRNSGTWRIERVDSSSPFVGLFSDMAMDRWGQPAISYYDSSAGNLKFARRSQAGQWITEVLDSPGDVGRFSSLAFFSDGTPAIAYYDASNSGLKYAVLRGTAWDIQRIAPELQAGYYPSLVIDASDRPLITFLSTTNDHLVYEALLVPEPGALSLLGLGAIAALWKRRGAGA